MKKQHTPNQNPEALNALQESYQIGHKVRHNFDWPNVFEVFEKLKEEVDELEESLHQNKPEQIHELGDVLFTLVQIARHLNINPEDCLKLCNERHALRMQKMRKLAGVPNSEFAELTLDVLEKFWVQAKNELKSKEKLRIQKFLENQN